MTIFWAYFGIFEGYLGQSIHKTVKWLPKIREAVDAIGHTTLIDDLYALMEGPE